MILIYQDSINQIVCTLAEKKLIDTDIYLLEFINILSNEYFYCVATDNSTSQYRYQRFCVTHQFSMVNPLLSQVNMKLEGSYEYNIYENPDSLLVPTGLNLVETGKMKCIGSTIYKKIFEPTVNTKMVFDPKNYS